MRNKLMLRLMLPMLLIAGLVAFSNPGALGGRGNIGPYALTLGLLCFAFVAWRRIRYYGNPDPIDMAQLEQDAGLDVSGEIRWKVVRRLDPLFDENAVLDRTLRVWRTWNKAMENHDLLCLRVFTADPLFARLQSPEARQRLPSGYTGDPEITLTDFTADNGTDCMTLTLSFETSPPVLMVFTRKTGTLSRNHHMAPDQCPHCGGQKSLGEDGVCHWCGTHVPGASLDWLLADIASA